MTFKIALTSLFVLALTACGGGGGGGTDSPLANVIQGSTNTNTSTSSSESSSEEPDTPEDPVIPEQPAPPIGPVSSLSITWDAPTTRDDGTAISQNEIQGYVLILVSETDIANNTVLSSVLGSLAPTLSEFLSNPQISNYLSNENIAQLISSGSPNLVVLPSNSTTDYTFSSLSNNTYYVAVSAYDFDNNYSTPGSTISAVLL